ncbi:hypothetical protein BP5796_07635 [Coleophoma crateriformis]|uniref:F-box domain-containing protein n=1 Tax=Coleophoma crateriformis TaxID=565419 RepID=A0A3D8RJG3_9HELO|nr:hypothetical protein BP5796_07635 [Coleophoma crateriformis]
MLNSPTLTALPSETLQLIFGTFCLHCSANHQPTSPDRYLHHTPQHGDEPSWYSLKRHALFSLCLVSKRCRDLAQPILYHEFVLGYGDSWRSTLYTWDGRLAAFVRTIAQRRQLAMLVKAVYIQPSLLHSLRDEKFRDALGQAAHALKIENWQQLSGSTLVPLLIAELPNLEYLSLETLQHDMCDGIAVVPSLSNLRTICIIYSRLGEKNLEALLSACPGLCTFVYEATHTQVEGQCTMLDGRDHFQPSRAVGYLRHHRATLKSLHLDLRWRGWSPLTEGRQVKPVFSFADFTALEHLFINGSEVFSRPWIASPADSQFLVKLLPPSITSLHLAGEVGNARPRLAKGLLGLAEAISQGKFPRFKQIRCDIQQLLDDGYNVAATLAAVEVDFGYDSWPLGKVTFQENDNLSLLEYLEPMPLPDSDYDSDL